MKKRRLISSAIALLLAVCMLPLSAFADTWYLEDGDITVSASENGQTVKQGSKDAVADNNVTITQRDSSTATSSTITVSTTGDATADITVKDINVSSDGDAIDVGSSSAKITLEGENKIFSESGSALHVSDGDVTITGSGSLEAEIGGEYVNNNDNAKIGSHEDEDMSGKIHITGSATVTTIDDEEDDFAGDGAGIGSGCYGDMSGDIIIDENANVTSFSQGEGAGIGSGYDGDMSRDITISDSAKVTAGSGWDGAGIGTGQYGDMAGTISIDGSAQVTAWSEDSGAGIGAGEDGRVSGTITIGGSAQVTAGSEDDGAGIGAGEDGSIASTGRIIIRDSAKVTAIGQGQGTGIGAGEDSKMRGLIIIQDNAQVTAIAGDSAAAIGSDDWDEMTGIILILGKARITTGVLLYDDDDGDEIYFDYDTKQIKYTLDENSIGYIGDGDGGYHASSEGHYVLGPDVTINGLRGSDVEALKKYINMRLSDENHKGEPENLTKLDIRAENGEFTATASGEGTVEKILYNGSESMPTAPGSYPVTVVVKIGDKTVEIEIGTLIVPEKPGEEKTAAEPLYRVTDKDGKDIAHKAERKDGVLTVTVDADFAILTGKLSGIKTLEGQGIEEIVFVTKGATSTFETDDLLERGGETYQLTHDGKTVTFTAGEKQEDVSEILE